MLPTFQSVKAALFAICTATDRTKAEIDFGGIWWSTLKWCERNDVECGRPEALHILNRLILGGLKVGLNQNCRKMFGCFFRLVAVMTDMNA